MKTKLLSLFLALAASVGTMFAWDYEHVQIGDLYYNLDASNLSAEVTSMPSGKYTGDIIIPSFVEYNSINYNVTSIGGGALIFCSDLTSITMSNNLTNIGDIAFQGCTNLSDVSLPEGLTTIGEYAFLGCRSINSLAIPSSVTHIGGGAFADCTGLTSLTVANDNLNYCIVDGVLFTKDITKLVFCLTNKQGAYTIPNSVTSIEKQAFRNCAEISSITIPNSVLDIGQAAFHGCSDLTSIEIPNSVTQVGQELFQNCTGLTAVIIPTNATSIGYHTFDGCNSLAVIEIPNNITTIREGAFFYCTGLTSVINNAITPQEISNNVFEGVDLTTRKLYVPAESFNLYKSADGWKEFGNILSIGTIEKVQIGDLYYNLDVSNLSAEVTSMPSGKYTGDIVIPSSVEYNSINYNVTGIGGMAFDGCTDLISLEIPNSIVEIGYYACAGSGLVTVTIPASVISMDYRAFDGCASLLSINVETDNPNFSSADGVLFDKNQTYLIVCPCGKVGSYTIPYGVTRIGSGSFAHCTGLTEITFPNTITSIGEWAFMNCPGLTSFSIPSSVTDIASTALITDYLTSINIDSNNPNYCSIDGVMYSKDQTKLICYPKGKQGEFSIPNHVTIIGEYAFGGYKMTSITIPNSVTKIEYGAFGSSNLSSVTIPNSVTSIADRAFIWCGNLSFVIIPNSVTNIEQRAFVACDNLDYIINYATTPQAIENTVFVWEGQTSLNFSECRLYVPAESVDAYRAAEGWSEFANILSINDFFNPDDPQNPGSYRVTLTAEPEEMGTVTGAGLYAQGTEVEISATPNTGYHFVNWSDENTEATRTITLTKDTTLTATFAPNLYAITFNNYNGEQLQQTDVAFGTLPVYEGSTPTRLDSAYYTFTFKGWKPAVVIVSGDAIYTAEYDSVFLGTDSVIVSNQADIAELPAGTITHLVVEQSGRITISEPRNIHALTLHMGTNNAQVSGISDLTVEEAELVLHMPENAVSAQWFAFAVPFKVSLASGIRKEGETEPAISGLHFVIDKYDGALRASEQNGWSRLTVTDTLYPGQLYMIAAYETPEAWRLTAAHPELIEETTSVNVSANQSALGDHHSGWNGIANTLWKNAAAELDGVDYVTTYNNQYGAYEVALMAEHEFLAAEPFFVQTPDNGSVIFSDHASSPSSAPMRMALSSSESSVYTLGLTEVKSGYTDKTYMTLNEDKVDTYIIGRDLEKMQRGVSAVPQLWTEAYDMRLAAHEVVYMDSVANVSLGLYAPIAGSYRLEIQGVPDQTSVLLTLDGNFVSTLSLSTIDLDLTEGDNTGYGLYICNASKIPTSIENLSANSGESRKLLRDGQIFILRGDKTYTIQGQQIK